MDYLALYDLINTSFTEIVGLFQSGHVSEAQAKMSELVLEVQEYTDGS